MNDRVFKHTEAHKLEDPERLKWLPPAEILAHLRVGPGMKVADIGAGTGYFSIPIARAVGALGHVFAVDLQPEMLDLLRGKLEQPNAPDNVSLHQGVASQVPLPDRSVHMILYANIWHEIEDLDSTFREAVRISVLGGKIAILDWRDDCSRTTRPSAGASNFGWLSEVILEGERLRQSGVQACWAVRIPRDSRAEFRPNLRRRPAKLITGIFVFPK